MTKVDKWNILETTSIDYDEGIVDSVIQIGDGYGFGGVLIVHEGRVIGAMVQLGKSGKKVVIYEAEIDKSNVSYFHNNDEKIYHVREFCARLEAQLENLSYGFS